MVKLSIKGPSHYLNFPVQLKKISITFLVRGTVIGHSNEEEPLTPVISKQLFKDSQQRSGWMVGLMLYFESNKLSDLNLLLTK